MKEISIWVNEDTIKRMDLVEEYKEAEQQGGWSEEDFLYEAINIAMSVYGEAKRAGLLTEDCLSIREDVVS